jgi:hypothetical protein
MGSRSYKCNNGVEEECINGRINSDAVDLCHNFIRQDFCVDATVGLAPPTDDAAIQQFIQNTIYQYAPGVQFPTDPIRQMTVIARNLSNNFVDVAIQHSSPLNIDIPPVTVVDATLPPNSEVALSAPDVNRLVASAEVPSRVRFFITVFFPVGPIFPTDPV